MRRGTLPLIIGAVGIMVLLGVLLCPAPRPPTTSTTPAETNRVVMFSEPLRYCIASQPVEGGSRVQVLVDGSGSMGGVRDPVLRYARWIEQGISRSRGTAGGSFRIAQFDRRRGIIASSGFSAFARDYQPVGETTLHEAIASSATWDVTYILTDGVDASGSGNGNCAGGVDAACVARAFESALLHPKGPSANQLGGLWIFPLRTTHDGVYYTERPKPADFDTEKLKSQLLQLYPHDGESRGGTTTKIDVRDAGIDRAGNLRYIYHGPRSLLLIVIARSDEVGRAAVASLIEVAEQNGVTWSESVAPRADARLSALDPIEIYPGWVPPVEWAALTASDATQVGTIDVNLRSRMRLAIDCPPQKRGEADYLLSVTHKMPSSRCVNLYQLPQFEYQVDVSDADQPALLKTVLSYTPQPERTGEHLKLRIACENGGDRNCGSNPIHGVYIAARRYDLGLPEGPNVTGPARRIVELSTSDPIFEPHFIYGFRQLLTFFYHDIATSQPRPIKLADLIICNGKD